MISRLTGWRPARYVVVGAICAAVNNVVIIGGDWLGAHYLPMNFLAFAIATPLGYWLHSDFTFQDSVSLRRFLRFTAGVATGFPISLLTMAILCSGLGVPVIIAAPFATVVLFIWNYASAHWAILGKLRLRS